MRITRYDESLKRIWDDWVQRSKNGTFLFLRDYMDYHRDRFTDHSFLVWDDKDRLIALLPANVQGDTLISHAGLTYGGFATDEKMKTPLMLEVFEQTLACLAAEKITRVIYKTVPHIYHRVPAEEDRYALFLCNASFVRRGVLTVVNNSHRPPFQERRVRGVKKARECGLTTRASEEYAAFWEILEQVLRQLYNTPPVHTLAEIELLHAHFPQNIRLFGCYRANVMVAGAVIYESARVAHTQYIAASEEGRACGALDCLFSFLLDDVYSQKPFFDFGTSDEDNGMYLNRGLIDQKEGFGARTLVHDHYEIRLDAWQPGMLRRVMQARPQPDPA